MVPIFPSAHDPEEQIDLQKIAQSFNGNLCMLDRQLIQSTQQVMRYEYHL